jgi:EmrB/QacA subfamily drug resistance transporter
MLLVSVNQTIVLVSLPAIFAGLHADPLGHGQASYLLWLVNSYAITTTVFVLTFGRLADTHGKTKFYNAGFIVFGLASLLCALTPSTGHAGALELIAFRSLQGVGGAMLFAVNLALLTDAFPPTERGFAYAINQLAFIVGNIAGVILGGLLAVLHWRLVFAVSVPIAFGGAMWSYRRLRDIRAPEPAPPDVAGNILFAVGVVLVMLGLSYGILPYGGHSLGWQNPMVIAAIAVGAVCFVAFAYVESRAAYPMFNLNLFRIRAFTAANAANVFFQLSRGGLQFILIVWLQAVWLPLHGVAASRTPLLAGLATVPLLLSFGIVAPLAGRLADRHGARLLATVGLLSVSCGLLLLATLGANFRYWALAVCLTIVGAGIGLFAAPNSTQLLGSVPSRNLGVATGMRQTLGNTSQLLSTAVFFTVIIVGLSATLPRALETATERDAFPASVQHRITRISPATAVFSAELGVNPLTRLTPRSRTAPLDQAPATRAVQSSTGRRSERAFAAIIARPFRHAMQLGFLIAAAMAACGAFASAIRGPRVIYADQSTREPLPES